MTNITIVKVGSCKFNRLRKGGENLNSLHSLFTSHHGRNFQKNLKDKSSIQIADTRDYWIRKAAGQGERLKVNYTSPEDISGQLEAICVSTDADNIFFKPPFLNEEQNLYIAYDIIGHPEDHVLHNIALINRRQVFDWKLDSAEQFVMIPNSFLPEKSFELEFGYVQKKDSLKHAIIFINNQSGCNFPDPPFNGCSSRCN